MRLPVIWAGCALLFSAIALAAPNGLVVCHTDYGSDSIYAGMLKGAIYSAFASAKVDSLTHSVAPFDILGGAFLLAEGCAAFPKGTTFCCIVDPGVGTQRKCLVLETESEQYFVGPDNGLLSFVAEKYGVRALHVCTNQKLWRPKEVSSTFQGRDILGPVAAAIASGTPVSEAGPAYDTQKMVRVELPESKVENGAAQGVVIRTDWYGNLVTNITAEQMRLLEIKEGDGVDVTVGKAHYAADFVATYGSVPPGDRLVLVQSSGYVELAQNMVNLAQSLGEGTMAPVTLRKMK